VYQLEARIQSADEQMRQLEARIQEARIQEARIQAGSNWGRICWGGSTWVFVVDGRRFVRVRDIVQVRVT
jgi:hypothetical protein